MARINDVRLYGMVLEAPQIYKDGKTDEYIRGYGVVVVLGRHYAPGEKPSKYDYPRILTRNKEQIAEMAKWKANDIVEIKGSLTTKNMTKTKICVGCGEIIKLPGTVVYIHPIFSEVRKSNMTQEEAIKELHANVEISNSAVLMGVLCREPKAYVNSKNHKRLTTYQLAVKRRFRIQEDPAETDADFPWVKAYGEQGTNDIKALRKGSVILVDGKLQVRERVVKQTCSHCQAENSWTDYSMEVVPHAVEYMRNFYSPEEILLKEKATLEGISAEVFSSESELDLPAKKPDDYVDEKDDESSSSDTNGNVKALIDKIFES